MATAKRVFKRKTGESTGVLLHLTNAEAEVLRHLVDLVSGLSKDSPRKYTDRIRGALIDAGVALDSEHYAAQGSVHFYAYPPRPKKNSKVGQETLKGIAGGTKVSPSIKRGPVAKVGDTIRFTTNYASVFKAGETGVVEEIQNEGRVLYGTGVEREKKFWIATEEYGPNWTPEYEVVSFQTHPSIKSGDRVKLLSANASFRAGEIVKVRAIGVTGSGLYVESIGCGPTRAGYVLGHQVELAA